MTLQIYPPPEETPWPSLGAEVCAFIEDRLCHGPGDLLGEPVELDDEQRYWIYRMYELYPYKHAQAGRRRFQRCALSLRKGSNKTEFAAWIAIVELHPDGPVRCHGWRKDRGVMLPVAGPVTDPYIPLVSYTEEQVEELAYGAMRRIIMESRVATDFDIGLERIMRLRGDGKAEAVSGSPNARDGARTTFQIADETHRLVLENQKHAWTVMKANLAKRQRADAWALETTTAPEPGMGSVAEETMEYVRSVEAQKKLAAPIFFYHRQASDRHDLNSTKGLRAAVLEASGPYVAKWSAIERIVAAFDEADADRAYLERVWLNRPVQSVSAAFDFERWKELARPTFVVPDGATITLGFDGSRYDDDSALVATHLSTGFQWPLGVWSPSETGEVSAAEVDGVVSDAFERWDVALFYADPPKWESWIATWAGRYGEKVVVEWWTNRRKPMAYAIRGYRTAMAAGELGHNGDPHLTAHIGNARRYYTHLVDEHRTPLWILSKERPDSPRKIDAAMAGVLSWEARNDARASGVVEREAGDYGITVGGGS